MLFFQYLQKNRLFCEKTLFENYSFPLFSKDVVGFYRFYYIIIVVDVMKMCDSCRFRPLGAVLRAQSGIFRTTAQYSLTRIALPSARAVHEFRSGRNMCVGC